MKIQIEVSDEIINNALVGAREGGTNYWAQSNVFLPHNKRGKVRLFRNQVLKGSEEFYIISSGKQNGERLWLNKEYKNMAQSFFDIEGNRKNEELFITHEAIERGLTLMADQYKDHFSDLIQERDDAITHDVFVQCCLLGDLTYS